MKKLFLLMILAVASFIFACYPPSSCGGGENDSTYCGSSPIFSVTSDVNLTENWANGTCFIFRGDYTFDCKGFNISNGLNSGFVSWQDHNPTIKNCTIFNYSNAVYLKNSTGYIYDSNISGSTAYDFKTDCTIHAPLLECGLVTYVYSTQFNFSSYNFGSGVNSHILNFQKFTSAFLAGSVDLLNYNFSYSNSVGSMSSPITLNSTSPAGYIAWLDIPLMHYANQTVLTFAKYGYATNVSIFPNTNLTIGNFTAQTTANYPLLAYPNLNTFYKSETNILANWSYAGYCLQSWFQYNGTNTTMNCTLSRTFNAINNSNSTITIFINNSDGIMLSAYTNFTVDNIAPTIATWSTPVANQIYVTTNLIQLTANITDTNIDYCNYKLNGNSFSLSTCDINQTLVTNNNAVNSLTIYGYDKAGNSVSSSITFTVFVTGQGGGSSSGGGGGGGGTTYTTIIQQVGENKTFGVLESSIPQSQFFGGYGDILTGAFYERQAVWFGNPLEINGSKISNLMLALSSIVVLFAGIGFFLRR